MFFTELKTRLAKDLSDTDNATFSDDEKTEALTKAIEESVVAVRETNTSSTFTLGTRDYTLADEVQAVYGVSIDITATGAPFPIDGNAWQFNPPNLTFRTEYATGIPTNAVLYIDWLRKLTIADDIPSQLVPFVLNQAIFNTTQMLLSRKINRFLRNDTTVAELLQAGQASGREANRLRKSLPARNFVEI